MANLEINMKQLQQDVDKYLKTFAKTYCKAAADNITDFAKSAIEQFYTDYSPHYYVRTHNLMNNSYERYFHDNGRIMYGGVRISSNNMHDNYNGTPEQVAWSGWHGYHGLPLSDSIQTTAPLSIVEDMMNNQSFLQTIESQAQKAADSERYRYI